MAVPASYLREIGHAGLQRSPLAGGAWYYDPSTDEPPELRFPLSVAVYDKMRRTDAQIAAVLRAITLPIRRTPWRLDPGDAPENVARHVALDLGLPLVGDEDSPRPLRARGRFSWSDHLRHALLHLVYGFMAFEQVYRLGDDGLAHLAKLAPRMPHTLDEVRVARDGGLEAVVQRPPADQPANVEPVEIPVDRVVLYVADREGANWYGHSLLRTIYPNWLLKERLIRLGNVVMERNALGVPTYYAPENATQPEIEAGLEQARRYRAGEQSAVAFPAGSRFELTGVTGSLPDPLPLIRYHDEVMARSVLAMFMQLGQTERGSRALGETFVDAFTQSLQAVVEHLVTVAQQHVVEDLVDVNYGATMPAPQLVAADVGAEQAVTPEVLTTLMQAGAITPDNDLESYLRRSYKLPDRPQSDAPSGQSYGYDLDWGILTVDERRAQIGLPPLPDGQGQRRPSPAEAQALAALAARRSTVPTVSPFTRGTPRRTLLGHEAQARVDFATIQADYEQALARVLDEYTALRDDQLEAVADQIATAVDQGQLDQLGELDVPAGDGARLLAAEMLALAQRAAGQAAQEARQQGRKVTTPDVDAELITQRATATDALLAQALGEVSGRKALAFATDGVTGADVAASVVAYIGALKGGFISKAVGGALTAAQNHGRVQTMARAKPQKVYASEINDTDTCAACEDVDGKQYATLAAALEDYPTGGYHGCQGGEYCRGTLVAVYR